MSSSTTSRKSTRAAQRSSVTPHEIWLAGLGAVSLTRRQLLAGVDQTGFLLDQFRGQAEERIEHAAAVSRQRIEQARDLAERCGQRLQSGVVELRDQVDAVVARAITEAQKRARRMRIEVDQRIRPVLAQFGLAEPVAARRAPARKSAGRGTPRKKAVSRRRKAA